MQMTMRPEWDFRFTDAESKILVRALIGKLKRNSEIEEAQRLANLITLARAEKLEEQAAMYREMIPPEDED